MPRRRQAVLVAVNYLHQVVTPIEMVQIYYKMVTLTDKNHAPAQCNFLNLNTLDICENFTLIKKYCVNRGIMNVFVDIVDQVVHP